MTRNIVKSGHKMSSNRTSSYLFGGRGSQSHEGRFGKLLPEPGKPPVCWPEIVTPRADAVCFVHGNQPKAALGVHHSEYG